MGPERGARGAERRDRGPLGTQGLDGDRHVPLLDGDVAHPRGRAVTDVPPRLRVVEHLVRVHQWRRHGVPVRQSQSGRSCFTAKQSGRYLAITQASQGIASVLGAWVATLDITLCFTVGAVTGLMATALVLTFKEPPRLEEGESQLSFWRNLRAAVGIAARRPVVRWLLLLTTGFEVVPFIVYYVLLQPYALAVALPLASLGVVVLGVQLAGVAASSLAHRTQGHVGLSTLVAGGIAITLASTTLLGRVPSIPALAFMLVVSLVPSVAQPLLSARLNDMIPSAQRATIISLSALIFELGLAVVIPMLLGLADVFGAPATIGFSAAVYAGTIIPLAILWRAAERTQAARA